MNYSRPIRYPNQGRMWPLWKWIDGAVTLVVMGSLFWLLLAPFFQTVESEDASVMGDIVVSHSVNKSETKVMGKTTKQTVTHVLTVEDVTSAERQRVNVPESYVDAYPEGSTYQGKDGVGNERKSNE